jgi:hypothetical protein
MFVKYSIDIYIKFRAKAFQNIPYWGFLVVMQIYHLATLTENPI